MHQRLMEILVKLLREIDASGDGTVRLKDLSEKLRRQGFSKMELDAALSWLTDRLRVQGFGSKECPSSVQSVRVLHPVERMVLTPEAYGYLLHLENVGLIDKDQMEAVIEKAIFSGMSEVTVDDIKMITASVLFSPENPDWVSQASLWADDDSKLKVQ
ncbi:MAG: DUF494 family protein [bacterium]